MSEDFTKVLAGRSVLVTGHTGFMGSWLVLWLHRLGAQVSGYALQPPTEPSHFEAAGVRDLLAAHYEKDIRNAGGISAAVKKASPDVVFHLAAQPLVRESYRSPRETFDVNVMGTACLLDALRETGKPCAVVVVTSDKCYENHGQGQPYRESDPMGGHDPYSASKGATELLVNSYRSSFFSPAKIGGHGIKLASARAGNVIGGGDWAKDRIVTDLVQSLSAGQPVPVRNPHAIRPWQHVLEPISGYLALAAKMLGGNDPAWCTGWNFGPQVEDQATVGELVERFCKAWGDGKWKDVSDLSQPHEAAVLRLSIDKAVRELNWRPRWNLSQAVERTARWYRRFYVNPQASMRDASAADIEAYCQARQD